MKPLPSAYRGPLKDTSKYESTLEWGSAWRATHPVYQFIDAEVRQTIRNALLARIDP